MEEGYYGERWVAEEGEQLDQGIRDAVCPGQERKTPSLDPLTWCHFEELVHLLGLCFDHGQLSHLSRGLRRREVQLHQLPLGLSLPGHPPSPSLSCRTGEVAGLRALGIAQKE